MRRAWKILERVIRMNRAYATSSTFRSRVVDELLVDNAMMAGSVSKLVREDPAETQRTREFEAAGGRARAHAMLTESALSLTAVSRNPALAPSLTVVFTEVRPSSVFAGVSTALDAAAALARNLGLPLRVITLHNGITDRDSEAITEYLERKLDLEVEVVVRAQIVGMSIHPDDVWMATHWNTAHALQVAAINGTIDASRVVYLIQDYEPGFNAWSTVFEIARGTYHVGFLPLVNSRPLADYLASAEGIVVPEEFVFSPALDVSTMEAVASARRSGPTKVLFYGRPTKPRNMFALGVAALRSAVTELGAEAQGISFVSAGQGHAAVDLGSGIELTSVGTLAWDDYFTLLTECDVVLSLQASPHPSHPPLEAAMTGAFAVTNEFAGTRSALHPRLRAASPEPEALGQAVADAVRRSRAEGSGEFQPVSGSVLGVPMANAIDAIAARLTHGSRPGEEH